MQDWIASCFAYMCESACDGVSWRICLSVFLPRRGFVCLTLFFARSDSTSLKPLQANALDKWTHYKGLFLCLIIFILFYFCQSGQQDAGDPVCLFLSFFPLLLRAT